MQPLHRGELTRPSSACHCDLCTLNLSRMPASCALAWVSGEGDLSLYSFVRELVFFNDHPQINQPSVHPQEVASLHMCHRGTRHPARPESQKARTSTCSTKKHAVRICTLLRAHILPLQWCSRCQTQEACCIILPRPAARVERSASSRLTRLHGPRLDRD